MKAFNAAGSITSGISSFVLSNIPSKPAVPTNDNSVTNDSRIKVLYGTTLPNNGGSPIISLHLQMDDG